MFIAIPQQGVLFYIYCVYLNKIKNCQLPPLEARPANKLLAGENNFYIQDGGEHGSRFASSEKTLEFFVYFSYVLVVLLLSYVLDVVNITVYDRHTLLNIGSSIVQRKPDFEFLNTGALFADTASESFVWAARPRKRRRRRTSSPNHVAG